MGSCDHDRRLRNAPRQGEVINQCCGKDLGPLREHEEPSEEDIERFSGVTRTCPSCKKEVFDDAELCYHCGEAIEGTSQGVSGFPPWVVVTAALTLAAFVAVILFR